MSFPAYPSYRDSGVEWLGAVPSHWEIRRVKDIAQVLNGYPFDSKLFDLNVGHPIIRIRDLNSYSTEVLFSGDYDDRFLVTRNDVLIGMDGDFNVGRWNGPEPALLNQRVCALRVLSPTESRLLEFALPAPLSRINDLTYSTTVKHLSSYQVEAIRIALPPSNELGWIISFLDRETARIDALIEEQQRLIELLKEKRQAVISHAVTKGLDPTAPMKDSGVEWLGEVPAHWEKTHLRYVASLNPSKSITSELPDEFEVVFLPMESIGEDGAIDCSQTRQLGDVRSGYSYFANGDVVLAKVTPCFENGKGAPVKGLPSHHGFGTTELTVLRPLTPDDQNFIWWLTASAAFRLPAKAEMVGAGGLKRVPDQFVAGFQLAWPPASERSSIATFLDCETIRIDTLVSEAEVSIRLLQERRSTLISAAVTGKIDVRGAVDPSRKPEPEPV